MVWALQDAKNKFSAVADTALHGSPQLVTRHGKPIVVILSYEMYQEKFGKKGTKNIWEAFRDCPVDVNLEKVIGKRDKGLGRAHEVDFNEVFA